MTVPVLKELMGGIPYEQLTPCQREEWAFLVRTYGFHVCETCDNRKGDLCYIGYPEYGPFKPKKVERDDWCNAWCREGCTEWEKGGGGTL